MPVLSTRNCYKTFFEIVSNSDRFDITPKGQQIHVAFHKAGQLNDTTSSRHICFRLESPEDLVACQKRIYEHFEKKSLGAPISADKPGEVNSGMNQRNIDEEDAVANCMLRCKRN